MKKRCRSCAQNEQHPTVCPRSCLEPGPNSATDTQAVPMSTPADPFYGRRKLSNGFIGGLLDLAEHVGADVHENDRRETVIVRIVHAVWHSSHGTVAIRFDVDTAADHIRVLIRGVCAGSDRALAVRVFQFRKRSNRWDYLVRLAQEDAHAEHMATQGCPRCGRIGPGLFGCPVNPTCEFCAGLGRVPLADEWDVEAWQPTFQAARP